MAKLDLKAEPGRQEIVMSRVFNAPRAKVFEAFVKPELIAIWWGGTLYKTTIDKMDAKPGGMWRFVQKGNDGNEHGFHGVYHDVMPPSGSSRRSSTRDCPNADTCYSRRSRSRTWAAGP